MTTRRWIHSGRGPLALTLLAFTLGAAITAVHARPRHKTMVEACAPDLASCPDRGCAEAGSPEAAVNEIKKTWPNSKRPVVLTFADIEGLQDQAEKRQQVVPTNDRSGALHGLKVAAGRAGEGDLVQIAGYVVDGPTYKRSGDSVNCGLSGAENNDFFVTVAESGHDAELDGIRVALIPYWRPKGWTLDKLRRISAQRLPVVVWGQLFYESDSIATPGAKETAAEEDRFSHWEVHPVTQFFVCTKEAGDCDPANLKDWDRLEFAFNAEPAAPAPQRHAAPPPAPAETPKPEAVAPNTDEPGKIQEEPIPQETPTPENNPAPQEAPVSS